MSATRKVRVLSFADKKEILGKLRRGCSQSEIARQCGCTQSAVSKLKKNEKHIKDLFHDKKRKRNCTCEKDDVDIALLRWLQQQRNNKVPVTGPLFAEKVAQILGHPEFQPSGGWIVRWKTRHGIKFLKIQGEKAAADFSVPLRTKKTNNIFNGDETGLFFKATPTGTLAFSGSDSKGLL